MLVLTLKVGLRDNARETRKLNIAAIENTIVIDDERIVEYCQAKKSVLF